MNEKLKKLKEEARQKILSDPLFGGDIVRMHIKAKKSSTEKSGGDEKYFALIDDLSTKDTRWKKVIIKAIGDFYLPSRGDLDILRGFARDSDWEISHQATKVLGNFCHKSELARQVVSEMVLDDFQMENIYGSNALREAGVKAPDFVIETIKKSLDYFQTFKKQAKYQYMRNVLKVFELIETEPSAEAALEIVLQYLDHPQLGVAAAEAMGALAVWLPDEKALNRIRTMARNTDDEIERAKAAAALSTASLQLNRVRKDLTQLLEKETSERVLYHAFRTLWWYADREADWVLNTVSEKMPLLQSEGTISVAFGILKKAAFRAPQKVYELSRNFSLPDTGRIQALYPLILWSCANDVPECQEELKGMIDANTSEEGLVACLAMTDLLRSNREGNLSSVLNVRILGEGKLLLLDYSDFFRKCLDIVLESKYRDLIIKHLFSALSSNPYPVISDLCECIGLVASRDEEVFSKVLSFDHWHRKFMMLRPCAATHPGNCEEALRIYAQQPTKELNITDSAVELMVELAAYNPDWPLLNVATVQGNSVFGQAEVFAKVYSASFDAQPENSLVRLDQLVESEFDPNFFYFWKRSARHRLPIAFSVLYGRAFDPKPISQKEALTLCEHFQWAVKQTADSLIQDEILLIYDAIYSILDSKESGEWKSLCTKLRQAEFTGSRLGQTRKKVAAAIANAFEKLETEFPKKQFQAAVVDIRNRLLLNPFSFFESHDTQIKEGSLSWGTCYTLMYLPEVRLATIVLNKLIELEEDTCAVLVENRMKFNNEIRKLELDYQRGDSD